MSKGRPPGNLPAYRILTGPDDAAFCHRVSEALALGYELYGSPAATFNGRQVIVAQAVVWRSAPGRTAGAASHAGGRRSASGRGQGRRT